MADGERALLLPLCLSWRSTYTHTQNSPGSLFRFTHTERLLPPIGYPTAGSLAIYHLPKKSMTSQSDPRTRKYKSPLIITALIKPQAQPERPPAP